MAKRHNIYDMYKVLMYCHEHTDEIMKLITVLGKVKNLAKQHHRQCENSCNGVGYVPRKGMFYTGKIDAYAKREYGQNIKSAYINDNEPVFDIEKELNDFGWIERVDETVFDEEMSRIRHKIEQELNDFGWIERVYHGDPRGSTVQLWIPMKDGGKIFIDLDLF